MIQGKQCNVARPTARGKFVAIFGLVTLFAVPGCWRDFRKVIPVSFEEHTEVYEWKAEQKKLRDDPEAAYKVLDEDQGLFQVPVPVAIKMVAEDPELLQPIIELEKDLSTMTLAQKGEQHFKITYACAACHDLQGNRKVGPALNNRWGKEAPLEGGEVVQFDDAYFKESVLYSKAKIARGYPPAMPVFNEMMSDEDFQAIKAYVMSYQ